MHDEIHGTRIVCIYLIEMFENLRNSGESVDKRNWPENYYFQRENLDSKHSGEIVKG